MKADHNLLTSFQTQLLMAWHNMAWLTEWFTHWLTFVPGPSTLSPEADPTTDSTTHSIDNAILRVLRNLGVNETFRGLPGARKLVFKNVETDMSQPLSRAFSSPLSQPLN